MTGASITTLVGVEAPTPSGPVSFDAPRGRLISLLLRIGSLSVVTLGFYRFWGKTRLRRFFWQHISIAGDRLDYVGRASELLIGFLIALVLLVPILAAPSIYGMLIADPVILVVTDAAHMLGLLVLIQVAIFRARRYRLTRTVWRGIRFGQDGNAFVYAGRSLACWLLTALTLGAAYPWARTWLIRYEVTHTWFGGAQFAFDAEAGRLFTTWLPVWAGCLAIYAAAAAGFWPVLMTALERGPEAAGGVAPSAMPLVIASLLAVVTLALFGRYRVLEFRYFAKTTSLAEIRFGSDLKPGPVLATFFIYGAGLVVMLLLAVVAFVAISSIASGRGGAGAVFGLVAALVVSLGALGAFLILNVAWLRYELVKAVAASLSISNLGAAERIVQSAAAAPRHGEGLADALDVGGF